MALHHVYGSNRAKIEALIASMKNKKETVISADKMPPIRDLEKKYDEFTNHFILYSCIYDAYCYVGKLLTSKEFTKSISPFYNETPNTNELFLALNRKDNDYYYIEVLPKTVNTKISFNDIGISLNNNKDPQAIMDAESILKSLFPTYKSPTKWVKKTVKREIGNGSDEIYSIGEDLVNFIPLKKFLNIKPKFTSTNDKLKPVDLKFSLNKKYFDGNFDNIASLKLTLKQSNVQPNYNTSNTGVLFSKNEGSLLDNSLDPYVQIEVEAVLAWPLEFAYYVTCANSAADFIPFLFFQYVTWHKAVYSGGRTRGGGMGVRPSRINHLGNVVERNIVEQRAGRNPKIRTNKDGFLTLGVGESAETGKVYWIPDNVNKVNDYIAQIKAAYNPTEKRFDLKTVKLKGEGLLTDPFNEKFVYLREEGVGLSSADISGLQTLDLTGSVALDDLTKFKHLSYPLDVDQKSDLDWFLSVIRKFCNGGMKASGVTPSKNYLSPEYLKSIGMDINKIKDTDNIKDYLLHDIIYNSVQNQSITFNWANIGGYPLRTDHKDDSDLFETKNPEKFASIRASLNFIKAVSEDMLIQIDKLDTSYIDKLSRLRYILFMITRYSSEYDKLKEKFDNATKNNEIVPISDAVFKAGLDNLVLPNMTGTTKVMPHQLETSIDLEKVPESTMLEVGAGGGKSWIQIQEICKLLYQGKINRAIVIAPGNLVRNWVNEIAYFSKGKVNAFALNIYTLRRMQYVYNKNPDPVQKPDYKVLKQIIEDLPKNTIFVTSYRFLANDRERIVYGNKIIIRYYIAEFLRDLGFDMVSIDESHTSKNLASNTTMATAILLSSAKYKRELSGTMVMDNLSDLVGQSGIMVPAALGSKSNFTANFSTNGVTGEWDIDAPQKITKAMRPYIKRIVHKRQKWAAMLPKLIEDFMVVNMTAKQKAFYDDILENKIEELKKTNPKLYAKLMDGNDKDAKAIETGLNTYFQAIEQFLYAPDSNEAFTQLEGLKPQDLISPKIDAVVKVLDNHFNGYTDSQNNKYGPSRFKVIIFSHRVQTSTHVMKYLPPKYKESAVLYHAGDFQMLQQFLTNDKVKILVADELCFPGYMNVMVDYDKCIPIETVYNDKSITHVLSYDLKTKKIIKRKITNRFKYLFKEDKDEWIDITVYDKERDEKKSFRTTINHMIFKSDGSEVRADSLVKGDKLITYGGDFEAYYKSEYTGEYVKRSQYDTHASKYRKMTCKICGHKSDSVGAYTRHMNVQHNQYKKVYKDIAERGSKRFNILWANKEFKDRMHKIKIAYRATEETKAKYRSTISDGRMKKVFYNRPKKDREAQIKRFINAPYYGERKANKVEQSVIDLNVKNMKFTGDGSYFITLNIEGVNKNKNPDFIRIADACGTCKFVKNKICTIDNEKVYNEKPSCQAWERAPSFRISKVVEIMDFEYWHSKSEINPLIKAYKEKGVECLILDAKMPLADKKAKIESHINNHYVEVICVRKAGKNTQTSGKFKYDLEVEKHHNYFVVAGSAPYTTKKPTIPILVHNSINTGQNLQIASLMIRLETLWSPGSQEQAIARIWRPAFKSGSDRQTVRLVWVYTNFSLEVAKIGRLISKIINKTRYDQQDNPYFTKTRFNPPVKFISQWGNIIPAINNNLPIDQILSDLPLIKMNTKTLLSMNDRSMLDEYFANYAAINTWEDKEFDRLKAEKRYASILEVPPSAYKEIPNSKTIPYIPRVPGVEPTNFDPDDKMGYKPISIIEDDDNYDDDSDSDNEGVEIEVTPVTNGTLVDTEFGFGRITKIMKVDVWVDIKGIGEVKVPKTTAWVITDPKAEADVVKKLNQPGFNNLRLPNPIMNILKNPPRPNEEEEEVQEEELIKTKPGIVKHQPIDEYDEEEETKELPIWAELVDTQIALTTEYDNNTEFLVEEEGWKLVPAYTSIQVPTASALEKIITKLSSKYQIKPEYISNLEYYKTMLQNHSLDTAKPNMVNQTIRFFGVEEHKKLKQSALRPFPIIWGKKFFIAFDKANTPSLSLAVQDIRNLGISGLHIVKQAPIAIKFYSNKDTAMEDLKKLNNIERNPHYDEALEFLKNTRVKRAVVQPEIEEEKPKPKITLRPAIVTPPKSEPAKLVETKPKKPVFTLNLKGRGKIT